MTWEYAHFNPYGLRYHLVTAGNILHALPKTYPYHERIVNICHETLDEGGSFYCLQWGGQMDEVINSGYIG